MAIKPEHIKLLEELGRTQFGAALRAYLEDEKESIRDVRNSSSWEDTLGRQMALQTIDRLFNFMKEKTPVVKKKNPYV